MFLVLKKYKSAGRMRRTVDRIFIKLSFQFIKVNLILFDFFTC